jgi:hypothetical protein
MIDKARNGIHTTSCEGFPNIRDTAYPIGHKPIAKYCSPKLNYYTTEIRYRRYESILRKKKRKEKYSKERLQKPMAGEY